MALVTASLSVAGCSADAPKPPQGATTTTSSSAPAKDQAPSSRYITDEELAKVDKNSPDHTILAFWQDAQYKNMLDAYNLLGKDFRDQFAGSLPRFSKFIAADFNYWLAAKPKIVSVDQHGNTANVIVSYRPPGGVEDRSTATLVREGGEWRIAFLFYLANRLRGS